MPKGLKGFQKGHIAYFKNKHLSEKHKRKISISRKGQVSYKRKTKIKLAKQHKENISKAMKGRMPKFTPLIRGENHYAWKGGVTSIYKVIRKSVEYKLWRKAVFARDNYTCIWCRTKNKTIKADHIKPFALYPKLRFAIDNGRTLCEDCHRTTDTYGNRTKSDEVESDIEL